MLTVAFLLRIILTIGLLRLFVAVSGKRGFGSAGALDLLIALVIGEVAQRVTSGQVALHDGVLMMGTLLWLHLLQRALARWSPCVRGWAQGTPMLLVRGGKVQHASLAREGITDAMLETLLREAGVEHLSDVRELRLEPDGMLSLLPANASCPITCGALGHAARPSEGAS